MRGRAAFFLFINPAFNGASRPIPLSKQDMEFAQQGDRFFKRVKHQFNGTSKGNSTGKSSTNPSG